MRLMLQCTGISPALFVSRNQPLTFILRNFTGSDTTVIALRSIFYHLMKNPEIYAELLKKIDKVTASGKLSSPPGFREASGLPFLCATIKEAMRFYTQALV
jgi:cytochrome P450